MRILQRCINATQNTDRGKHPPPFPQAARLLCALPPFVLAMVQRDPSRIVTIIGVFGFALMDGPAPRGSLPFPPPPSLAVSLHGGCGGSGWCLSLCRSTAMNPQHKAPPTQRPIVHRDPYREVTRATLRRRGAESSPPPIPFPGPTAQAGPRVCPAAGPPPFFVPCALQFQSVRLFRRIWPNAKVSTADRSLGVISASPNPLGSTSFGNSFSHLGPKKFVCDRSSFGNIYAQYDLVMSVL